MLKTDIYVYRCNNGHEFNIQKPMIDWFEDNKVYCPVCKEPMKAIGPVFISKVEKNND